MEGPSSLTWTLGAIFVTFFLLRASTADHHALPPPSPSNNDSVSSDDPCYFWSRAEYVEGKCFGLFAPTKELDWDDAQTACQMASSGGGLAETRTVDQLLALPLIMQGAENPAWLGITDRSVEGTFVLASNNVEITIFGFVWGDQQPDDATGNQDCLAATPGGKIQDDDCNVLHGYLCQQTVSDPCQEMLPGGLFHSGICYLYVGTPLSWHEAQNECARRNSLLAEPSTTRQINFVTSLAQSKTGDEWLGGCADGKHDNFLWYRSGIDVPTVTGKWYQNGWQNWDGDTPSYLHTLSHGFSRWTFTDDGDSKKAFICQMDVGNPCESQYTGSVYANGFCLKIHTLSLTWKHAQDKCHQEDADLVELLDDQIYHATTLLVRTRGAGSEAFIGLSDDLVEGTYRWSSSGGQLWANLWDDREPKSAGPDHDYVAIGPNGRLKVMTSSTERPFVCMKGFSHQQNSYYYAMALPYPQPSDSSSGGVKTNTLEITTAITSQRVYVTVTIATGETSSDADKVVRRSHVTDSTALVLHLSDDAFIDRNGVFNYHLGVVTSHPVSVSLVYFREDTVASSMVVVPPVRQDKTVVKSPSSYFLFLPLTPTTSDSGQTQVTIATTLKAKTRVVIRMPEAVANFVTLDVGGMEMRLTGDIETTLAENESLFLRLRTNLDGVFVWSAHPVVVMLATWTDDVSSNDCNYAMSYVMPTSVTSDTYVTFPTLEPTTELNEASRSVYVITAIYDDTRVQLYETGSGMTHSATYSIAREGSVLRIEANSSGFHLVKGSKPFYLYKISTLVQNNHEMTCLTPILPQQHWRSEYSFNTTSLVDGKLFVYVIMDGCTDGKIILDGHQLGVTHCVDIPDTKFKGCYFTKETEPTIWNDTVHHLRVTGCNVRFGAYIAVASSEEYLCHALGVRDDVEDLQPSLNLDDVYSFIKTVPPTATTTASLPSNQSTVPAATSQQTIPPSPSSESTSSKSKEITATAGENSSVTSTQSDSSSSTTTKTSPNPVTGDDTTTASNDSPTSTPSSSSSSSFPSSSSSSPPSTPLTIADTQAIIKKLQSELEINVRTTSAFKRTKMSVSDRRVTSTAIGAIGVTVMCLTFGFFVISDVISATQKIMKMTRKFRGKTF